MAGEKGDFSKSLIWLTPAGSIDNFYTMQKFTVSDPNKPTILAALRANLPDKPSWSTVRKLLRRRFVTIGNVLCIDESRRLSVGEVVAVTDHPRATPPTDADVSIVHLESSLVVVEKPSGMVSLRHKSEYSWQAKKRNRQPTLDECTKRLIAARDFAGNRKKGGKLYPVHRLDRDSSGLLVFARDPDTQAQLIKQFANHSAIRNYLALVPGRIESQTIQTRLIRDRGDGLRGSSDATQTGKIAVTQVSPLRTFQNYSEIQCRLQTGRTNQIRIHLAEAGHPICGDIKYRGPIGKQIEDQSGIRRLALHSTTLQFLNPQSNDSVEFTSEWPLEIIRFLQRMSASQSN